MKFIGAVVQPYRKYIANRTKGNLYDTVNKYYKIVTTEHRELNNDEIMHLFASVNSYFWFMKHYKTYKIRYKFLNSEIFKPFYNYFYTNKSLSKIQLYKKYNPNYNHEIANCGLYEPNILSDDQYNELFYEKN